MAKIYKENRVDIRPVARDAVVNIKIPTQEIAQRRTRFLISQSTTRDDPSIQNEEDFARRYLSTQGSIYFRQRKVYPRIFLWRIIDDSKVLEIQSADLVKNLTEHHEANLTLRLDFQEAIIPSGVACADTEEHEVLNVFVITASKQLHTLSLRPEFFRRAASIDENVSDWCKSYTPAPLAFAYPHRLHAGSTTQLFVSLDNGALLRLTRKAGDDGSHWTPITFHERCWGSSLRGLVKWHIQQPIQHHGRSLDQNTASSIATTSDQMYVFAVCLNHTLRIWDLATNKQVGSKDLLDRQVQPRDSSLYFLNPSDTSFIRVFNAERAMDGEYRYYVATFSPHEDGRFKFWAIKGGPDTQFTIEDLFPHAVLKPLDPDPSGNMFWGVADFQVKPMEEGRRMELWILWRNNQLYQLYSLQFNFQSLVDDWSTNWMTTALETRRDQLPPALVVNDNVDPTEKWLKYLLHPGKYTPEVLETALAVYQEALKPGLPSNIIKGGVPFQERLCSAITATISLRKYSETDMDFARYRMDTDTKWRQFWQIVDDINIRGLEPISLAYDFHTDTPWVLLTSSCVLIRECSSTEILLHNTGSELRDSMARIEERWQHRNLQSELDNRYDKLSNLIEVAASFAKKLSPDLHRACEIAIGAEIFQEPSVPAPDRLSAFQERCGLGERVSNEAFDSLCATMNENLDINNLPSDLFYAILDTVPLGFPGKDSDLVSTPFGLKATVSGSQETIVHIRRLLYELLILVVFVDGEINQVGRSPFDGVDLFSTLIDMLKEYEMMTWLSSHVRASPRRSQDHTHDNSSSLFSLNEPDEKGNEVISTILEDLFAIHIKPRLVIGVPQSYVLTQGIRDVLSWVTRQGEVAFPNVLVFIQCDLIANGNVDLASDFLRFQPSTAWATYAKGRLYVARSEFDIAAIYFQKAAHLLSSGRALGNLHEMSSNLVDILSVDSFNNGLAKYFQHILTVFEQARSFSHVADFASLALQALESDNQKAVNDLEYASLRTDLLSRLFHASLKTSKFDQAYSALCRYTDLALQKSALGSLITSIFTAYRPGTTGIQQLLHFPLSLTPHLLSYVDETLVSLAKKQSFNSPLDPASGWPGGNVTPDYHRILHAYRIARNDFRGAAEVGYQTVQRLRKEREAPRRFALTKRKNSTDSTRMTVEDDPESMEIRHELLALINLLACLSQSEAYILVEEDSPPTAEPEPDKQHGLQMDSDETVFMENNLTQSPTTPHRPSSVAGSVASVGRRDSRDSRSFSLGSSSGANGASTQSKPQRRVVVTLEQLRREYQAELDRVSRIERGDWEFGAIDGPESRHGDDDTTMLFS